MTLDVMIDIETLGHLPGSAIVAIGGCKFDRKSQEITDTFYRAISIESAMKYGGVTAGTISFWLEQPDDARKELLSNTAMTLPDALKELYEWFPKTTANVWGNGPSFDMVMIEGACRRSKQRVPWKFWHHRCFRTIVELGYEIGIPYEKDDGEGTLHNALDDSVRQAKHLMRVLNHLLSEYDEF